MNKEPDGTLYKIIDFYFGDESGYVDFWVKTKNRTTIPSDNQERFGNHRVSSDFSMKIPRYRELIDKWQNYVSRNGLLKMKILCKDGEIVAFSK